MRQAMWTTEVAMVLMLLATGSTAFGQLLAPEVTNVQAAQLPGGQRLVQITYDLAVPPGVSQCSVWVVASKDGGATWNIPPWSVSGDVNLNVTPGTGKSILWDAGADIPGVVGTIRVRVYAADGDGMADMVHVPADSGFPTAYSFWIDKYEVTNLRYCEFLNAADPAGTYYDSSMEISKYGPVYQVLPGRQDYPIRYVSYDDASAFAAWLSQRESRTYRLPRADEWYKAAAWDPIERKAYTYGFHRDTIDCSWCVYNNCYGSGGPLPVGSLNGAGGRNDARSYYGCYDMSGNVWEWTSELIGSSRVLRGGAWYHDASYCACAYRNGLDAPSHRVYDYGFRLVLDAP